MEVEINKETEKPLLERKEVEAMVLFNTATPSRAELKKELSKRLKTEESLVAIKKISTAYGGGKAKVLVHVYKDPKQLLLLERKERPKEAKKEEAPK